MAPSRRTSDSIWLASYVALLAGLAAGTIAVRNQQIRVLSSRDQRASWDSWRETAAKQDGSHGPVEREVPPSAEPPMLVLLRDHFPMILVASVLFPGLILGFLLLMIRGVIRQSAEKKSATDFVDSAD